MNELIYEKFKRTNDLLLASVLYYSNAILEDIEQQGREAYFIFQDEEFCNEIEKKLLQKKIKIEPIEFHGIQRYLKNALKQTLKNN